MSSNGTTHPPPPDAGVNAICEDRGHQWSGNVCVRCGHVVKPCAKRMRSTSGSAMWCALPSDHAGDCHGVTARELDATDYGPNYKRLEPIR